MACTVRRNGLVLVVLALAVATACRDSLTPQPDRDVIAQWFGDDTLVVFTNTSGSDPDPDGYTVTIDGDGSQPIPTNGSATFPNVSAEDHSVALSGLAANCTVSGDNPRIVTVPAGGSASTTFTVTCGGATAAEVSGNGQINSGEQTFAFDVRSDLTGTLTYTDNTIPQPSGAPTTLHVDPATYPGTAITAFRSGSGACADPARGAEYDGIAQVEGTADQLVFTVAVCDNGPPGSGTDYFAINVPSASYSRAGTLTAGDIALGSSGGSTGPARITGLGQLGTGSPTPGNNVLTFDFDVAADLTGRFTASDYTDVRSDGSVGTVRVDPSDPGTGITAFRTSSSACSDPSRGAEFDATGREDTGGLVAFTVVACDTGGPNSGMDFFGVAIPSEGYSRSGPVASGDVAKSGS